MRTNRITPTSFIIIICVIMFLPSMISTNFLANFSASHYTVVGMHQYYRLITAMFCHFGFAHISCNMISLSSIGPAIEQAYGNKKMFILFIATGVFATLSSVAIHGMIGDVNTVGASGAICGLIGAYMAKMNDYGRLDSESVIRMLFPIILMFLVPGIDNIAHITGVISGYLLGSLFCKM